MTFICQILVYWQKYNSLISFKITCTYESYDDYHYEEDPIWEMLHAIFISLCLLTSICFVIMIVVCAKCCCCSGSQERRVFAQNSTQVPPPFIYVTPFLQQSQAGLQPMTASNSQMAQPGAFLQAHHVRMPQSYVE